MEKRCFMCGSTKMKDQKDYYLCKNCGFLNRKKHYINEVKIEKGFFKENKEQSNEKDIS